MGSNGERRTGRVGLSLITSWVSSTPLVSAAGGQQSYAGCAEYGQRVRGVTALLCPHLHVHVHAYTKLHIVHVQYGKKNSIPLEVHTVLVHTLHYKYMYIHVHTCIYIVHVLVHDGRKQGKAIPIVLYKKY